MNRYPGLYREENKTGNRFRILINYDKEIIQEYFYFGKTTSEAKAKKAALVRWRELREYYPVMTKRRFRELPRNPTESGITGVTRIKTEVRGHEYEFWKACWTTKNGARRTKQFSIKKYGEKNAKKLAIQARNEAMDAVGKV